MKKYVRVKITVPKNELFEAKVIKEDWRENDDQRAVEFLESLDSVLSETPATHFLKIRNSNGDIEIVPRELLRYSHIKLEYTNHRWMP